MGRNFVEEAQDLRKREVGMRECDVARLALVSFMVRGFGI